MVLENGIFGIRDGVLGFWCIWDSVFGVFGMRIWEERKSKQRVFKKYLVLVMAYFVLENGIFGIRDGVLDFWCIWDLVFGVFGMRILEERKSKQKGLQKVCLHHRGLLPKQILLECYIGIVYLVFQMAYLVSIWYLGFGIVYLG